MLFTLFVASCVSTPVNSVRKASISFTPDERVQRMTEAYSLDACDYLRDQAHINLDWSDASIQQIELVLATFHRQALRDKPSEEKMMRIAKMMGSYVGEVYRKNHGAVWGIATMNGQRLPALETKASHIEFWPWAKAYNRIANGEEDNVLNYYKQILKDDIK